MKRFIIASSLVLATALSGSLMAETSSSERQQRYLDRLSERLELTPEQKREVAELHAEQLEKRKALRDESRTRMNEILTSEQSQALEAMHREHAEKLKKHHGKRGEPRQQE